MKTALKYLFVYLAWIALAVLGFWLLFQIRTNLLDIMTIVLEDPDTMRDTWILRGIDRWFIMIAGAIWVFCVTLLEGYFRNSVERQQITARLGRAFLIVGGVTGASLLLQQIVR